MTASNERKTRECPYCKEDILSDAIKCKHCGTSVSAEKSAHEGICPFCKEKIKPEAIKCYHCKSNLMPLKIAEESKDNVIRGLGDVIARSTTFMGMKPCSGCKKRQDSLNKFLPFSRSS